MAYARLIGTLAVVSALLTATAPIAAAEDGKYPDWSGAWARFVVPGLGGQPSHDQTKPWGLAQQAPLTEEYRKVLDASLADQANGGQGNFAGHALCQPGGMPLMMIAFRPLEFVVTPKATYVLIGGADHFRRIFTDGRDWPKEIDPSFRGQSIGKWLDSDADGSYDTLEVETRHLKGPRTFDSTGIPMHNDNKTVVKERIFWDKANPDTLRNDITTIDNALTHPWTITKIYRRAANKGPIWWRESICAENNSLVRIGKEVYYTSADGLLMPAKKDQPPPDLRYFNQSPR
jgi:hypothetical protein